VRRGPWEQEPVSEKDTMGASARGRPLEPVSEKKTMGTGVSE